MAMVRLLLASVVALAGGSLIVSLGGIHWQPPLAGIAMAPFALASALILAPAVIRFSGERNRRRAPR